MTHPSLSSFVSSSVVGFAVLLALVVPATAHADEDAGTAWHDGGDCFPAPTGSVGWPAPPGSGWESPSSSSSAYPAGSSEPACSDDGLCDGKAENDPCDDDNASVCVLVSCGGRDVLACKVGEESSSSGGGYDISEGPDSDAGGCSIGGAGGAEAASLFTVLGLLLPFASGLRRRRRIRDSRDPRDPEDR